MRKHTLCAALTALTLFTQPALAAESATGTLASADGLNVSHSTSRVAVDGFLVTPEGYCINQENYYKLRDLAFLLTGKSTAFDVVWDDTYQCISMLSGRNYTVAGGEMAPAGNAPIYKFVPSYSEVRLNGEIVQMTGYNINNNNYYRIRDVGPLIGFGVDWDGDTSTVVIDSKSGEGSPPFAMLPTGELPGESPVEDSSMETGTESSVETGAESGLESPLESPFESAAESSIESPAESAGFLPESPAEVPLFPPGSDPTVTTPETPSGSVDDWMNWNPFAPVDPSNPSTPQEEESMSESESEEESYPWIGPKIDGVLTILLDPGHGGTDNGCYNKVTKQNENTTNLAIAQYLKEMLEASGVRVIMSRNDTTTTLQGTDRKNYVRSVCEQGELDLVFSIHHNGFNQKAHGSEVYVQAPKIAPLAGTEGKTDPCTVSMALGTKLLQSYMNMNVGLVNRGVKETSSKYMVYTPGDYGIPAILSEFCFIDHADDVKLIDEPHEQQAEARAMYNTIMEFYKTTPY